MSTDTASSIYTIPPMNTEERHIINDIARKITKATDPEKINDLITDHGEAFGFLPTAKLNRLNKIDGYRFYKRCGQTYFSKKTDGAKRDIAEIQQDIIRLQSEVKGMKSDITELKETLTGILQHLKIIG
jgi:hypothetical protein